MTTTTRPDATAADAVSAAARLELPVLDEVPELGAALEAARTIDRLTARLLAALLHLEDHAIAEATTGVALEQWLAIVGRRTHADRRMLLTACDALRRLPSLRSAFLVDATVSWAQVRAVALAITRVPRHLDDAIDGAVGEAVTWCAAADPDALCHAVGIALASLDPRPQADDQQVAERAQFLAMQPRLDGSGGRVWGEFGPEGFATLDARLHPEGGRGHGATRQGIGTPTDQDRAADVAARSGERRARRLLELVELGDRAARQGDPRAARQGDPGAGTTDDAVDAGPGARVRPGRQLLVRVELGTLLDRDALPASLLTTLTGGRMWVDAPTARRLADERGADLRAVVVDDTGAVVGVGRRTRVAPGWLRDAALALHDTCTEPGCQVAARVCELDHATPWHPADPVTAPGRTDVANVGPLCGTANHAKEREGWSVRQHRDGTRTWHHARSGLTTRTHPAAWRPPPDRSPP
jgi:hypothetical protein